MGKKLGLGVEETAEAILAVVNQRMAGRIRLLSIERGHDPRDFALVAFGGAGPVHGAALMQEVGIGAMLVPPYPGVLCAMGCASANVRYDYSRTVERVISEIDPKDIAQIMREQRAEGEAAIRASEAPVEALTATHYVDMAYLGQIHAMRVPVEGRLVVRADDGRFQRRLQSRVRQHARRHSGDGHQCAHDRRGQARAVPSGHDEWRGFRASAASRTRGAAVHFGHWMDTPIFRRNDLKPGMTVTGPAIVEQSDTTTVVEPRMSRAR